MASATAYACTPKVRLFHGRSSDLRIRLLPGAFPSRNGHKVSWTVAIVPGFIPAHSAGQTCRIHTGFPIKLAGAAKDYVVTVLFRTSCLFS
jgi:hypothetical protein